MIDFIKLMAVILDWEEWQQLMSHVDLVGRHVHGTGVLVSNKYGTVKFDGEYGGYDIVAIRPEDSLHHIQGECYLDVRGSMHKASKDGANHSAFSWRDLQTAIDRLSSMFLLNEHNARITNIEFGANIELPFDLQAFLHDNLLLYKHREFSTYPCDRRGRSIGRECSFTHYTVKAYDKGLQYDMPGNLFRFELKYRNTQEMRRLGIEYLSDLRNKGKVTRLADMLMDAWDNVLVSEPAIIGMSDVTGTDTELSRDGTNPRYWVRLKRENRKAFEHKRRAYRALTKKHGQDLHRQVSVLLKAKVQELLDG